MSSEWMKVMLDEIARKKAEAEQMRAELEHRSEDAQDAVPAAAALHARKAPPGDDAPGDTMPGDTTPGVTHE